MPAPPSVDGASVSGIQSASGPVVTSGLTTTNPNDIIIVFSSLEGPGATLVPSVTSVTGGGLTFTRRYRNAMVQGPAQEFWWALSPSPLSNVPFTITYAGSYDDAACLAFGVSGCNVTTPFDPNSSLPNGQTAAGGLINFTVSTTTSNTLLLMGLGNSGNNTGYVPTAPFTTIGNIVNPGGAAWAWANVSGHSLTGPVTGATYSSTIVSGAVGGILDALTATGPSSLFVIHPFV